MFGIPPTVMQSKLGTFSLNKRNPSVIQHACWDRTILQRVGIKLGLSGQRMMSDDDSMFRVMYPSILFPPERRRFIPIVIFNLDGTCIMGIILGHGITLCFPELGFNISFSFGSIHGTPSLGVDGIRFSGTFIFPLTPLSFLFVRKLTIKTKNTMLFICRQPRCTLLRDLSMLKEQYFPSPKLHQASFPQSIMLLTYLNGEIRPDT